MVKKKKVQVYDLVKIAVVRDIAQRGWFSCLIIDEVRPDGWVRADARWFSPDNVLWHGEFTPRPWNGNSIAPGTLCLALTRWYPKETWETCIVLSHVRKSKSYQVIRGSETKTISDQQIVPIFDPEALKSNEEEKPESPPAS